MTYLARNRRSRRRMGTMGDYPDDPTPAMCTASPTMTGCPAAPSSNPSVVDNLMCMIAGINCANDFSSGAAESPGVSSSGSAQDTSTPMWVSTSGVCIAANSAYLAKFKELQRQLNRCLSTMSQPLIAVDGVIGPGTLKALTTISGSAGAGSNVSYSTCAALAAVVDSVTANYHALGDSLGAPSSVSSPSPSATPSYVNPKTGAVQPQPFTSDVSDFFQNMSTTEQAGVAALAVGIGYFAYTSLGKKKRK